MVLFHGVIKHRIMVLFHDNIKQRIMTAMFINVTFWAKMQSLEKISCTILEILDIFWHFVFLFVFWIFFAVALVVLWGEDLCAIKCDSDCSRVDKGRSRLCSSVTKRGKMRREWSGLTSSPPPSPPPSPPSLTQSQCNSTHSSHQRWQWCSRVKWWRAMM